MARVASAAGHEPRACGFAFVYYERMATDSALHTAMADFLDSPTDAFYAADAEHAPLLDAPAGMSAALRAATEGGSLEVLQLHDVRVAPFNARRYFDPAALESLAYSLLAHGQMQPIVVRRLPDDDPEYLYEIIAGERRYRALALTSVNVVKAFVLDGVSDANARRLMLAENLQRSELSPWDELQSILGLLAAELSTVPRWPSKVDKADGDESLAVARLLRSVTRSLPMRPDGAAMTLGIATEKLEGILDSVFAVGSTTSLATFTRRRLPLLSWPADVREALQRGTVPFASAEIVKGVTDERLRADLLEGIERGVLRTALDVREARDGLMAPPATLGEDGDEEATPSTHVSSVLREVRRIEARLTANERRSLESALRKLDEVIERVNARMVSSAKP